MNSKQRGGVVSFVIVAIVLAGLLAGGLYLSKHQARVAHDTNTNKPQVTVTQKPASNDKNENTGSEYPAGSSNTNSQQGNNSGANTPSTSTNQVANTGPSEGLPSTGPTETVAGSVSLFVLVFAGYKAFQSRRNVSRSALQ